MNSSSTFNPVVRLRIPEELFAAFLTHKAEISRRVPRHEIRPEPDSKYDISGGEWLYVDLRAAGERCTLSSLHAIHMQTWRREYDVFYATRASLYIFQATQNLHVVDPKRTVVRHDEGSGEQVGRIERLVL